MHSVADHVSQSECEEILVRYAFCTCECEENWMKLVRAEVWQGRTILCVCEWLAKPMARDKFATFQARLDEIRKKSAKCRLFFLFDIYFHDITQRLSIFVHADHLQVIALLIGNALHVDRNWVIGLA